MTLNPSLTCEDNNIFEKSAIFRSSVILSQIVGEV